MSRQAAEAPIVNAWSTKSTLPFFRVGHYAPVFDELTAFGLPVVGAIPPELNGWYLRNGPNPRQNTPHWFTGDGMIHGAGELSGWYLSCVCDPSRDGNDLVIIDATDFTNKPVARVQLPRRVPYGFHGNWIAG